MHMIMLVYVCILYIVDTHTNTSYCLRLSRLQSTRVFFAVEPASQPGTVRPSFGELFWQEENLPCWMRLACQEPKKGSLASPYGHHGRWVDGLWIPWGQDLIRSLSFLSFLPKRQVKKPPKWTGPFAKGSRNFSWAKKSYVRNSFCDSSTSLKFQCKLVVVGYRHFQPDQAFVWTSPPTLCQYGSGTLGFLKLHHW